MNYISKKYVDDRFKAIDKLLRVVNVTLDIVILNQKMFATRLKMLEKRLK